MQSMVEGGAACADLGNVRASPAAGSSPTPSAVSTIASPSAAPATVKTTERRTAAILRAGALARVEKKTAQIAAIG